MALEERCAVSLILTRATFKATLACYFDEIVFGSNRKSGFEFSKSSLKMSALLERLKSNDVVRLEEGGTAIEELIVEAMRMPCDTAGRPFLNFDRLRDDLEMLSYSPI